MQKIFLKATNYHSIGKLVLQFCIITIALLFSFNLATANNRTIEDHLMNLMEQHGEVFFEAIASLPETKIIYSENIGKTTEEQCLEYSLLEKRNQLNENQKKTIVNASIKYLQKKDNPNKILKKINHWCIAKRNFEIMINYEGVSEETISAALYANSLTKPLFDRVLKNRKIGPKDKVTPFDIAATLSSTEHDQILCDTMKKLSDLNKTDLMLFFSNILKWLAIKK